MAAPIRFGIEKNSPAMGILSSKLAEKPNATRQCESSFKWDRFISPS
jgi:hypothetical protein